MDQTQTLVAFAQQIQQQELAKIFSLKAYSPYLVTTTKGQIIGLDTRTVEQILDSFYKKSITGRACLLLQGSPDVPGYGAVYLRPEDLIGVSSWVDPGHLEVEMADLLQQTQPVEHELLK